MTAPTLAAPTDTGACGTPAGHQRHRRRGETSCEPCRQSRVVAARQLRADRAAARALYVTLPEDREAAQRALPLTSGQLACTSRPHPFVGQGTQCIWCWGWVDDPRHPVLGGPMASR